MKTATFSDFRKNMKEYLDEILADQDILILSGPKKKDFVVLTLEQFNAMEETSYLLSTTSNTERLLASIQQDKEGKVTIKKLDIEDVKTPRKRTTKKKIRS